MNSFSTSVEFGARAGVGRGGENGDHGGAGELPAEDDGVLLFTLLSPSAMNHVQLVLLDAADFSEVAKIAFRANGTVTEGFHGVFVPDDTDNCFLGY